MTLRTVPDPILRTPSVRVQDFVAIQPLVEQLFETCAALDGVGLAANQVGQAVQIAVMLLPKERLVMVNPVIVRQEGEEWGREGCLSIPGVEIMVPRAAMITLLAYDVYGKLYAIQASGLRARIIQHELDHLQGKLILDYEAPHESDN